LHLSKKIADIVTANFTLKQRTTKPNEKHSHLLILFWRIWRVSLEKFDFSCGILTYPVPLEDRLDKHQCTSVRIKHYRETGNGELIFCLGSGLYSYMLWEG